jgi:esterase
VQLNYKKQGTGKPLIILHGLFGMLDNWQTHAKKLSEKYCVYNVDLRNHGHSPHSKEFTYQAMANDILELIENENLSDIVLLGHSMGGKTAMKFAQQNPEYVDTLIIVDIAPKAYPVQHDGIIDSLLAVSSAMPKTRKEAEEIMSQKINDIGVRQFLLKSLYWKEKDKLEWRFNLKTIAENIGNVGEEIIDRIYPKKTLFIRGAKSDYITDTDFELIKISFSLATFITIPNAGHWVHAEQPELFLKAVESFLNEN